MPTPKRINDNEFTELFQAIFAILQVGGDGLHLSEPPQPHNGSVLSRLSAILSPAHERMDEYLRGNLADVSYGIPETFVNVSTVELEGESLRLVLSYSHQYSFVIKSSAMERTVKTPRKKPVASGRRKRPVEGDNGIAKNCKGAIDI